MLRAQRGREIDETPGLFEAREQIVFLELLVIVLDEVPNDVRAVPDGLRRDVLARCDAPDRLVVHQHDALQHAMLAHQVFRRRDAFVADRLLAAASLIERDRDAGCRERRRQELAARDRMCTLIHGGIVPPGVAGYTMSRRYGAVLA